MDWNALKISLQTQYVKIRGWVSFVASLAYIGLFLAGVYILATGSVPADIVSISQFTVGEFVVTAPLATVGVAVSCIVGAVALMFRSRKGSHTVIGDRVD